MTTKFRMFAPITGCALAATLLLGACGDLNQTQQRALTGAGAGAAGGALIGAIGGNAGLGAVLGAGAGLAGGLVTDKVQKDKAAAYERGVADGRKAKGG